MRISTAPRYNCCPTCILLYSTSRTFLHTLVNWELFPNVSVAYSYHHLGMVAVCYLKHWKTVPKWLVCAKLAKCLKYLALLFQIIILVYSILISPDICTIVSLYNETKVYDHIDHDLFTHVMLMKVQSSSHC